MKKYLLTLIAKASAKIASSCDYFIRYPQSKRVVQWFEDKGDETWRLHYPELNAASTVFDLGGYQGQWASDIYAKYNCTVYIFEPYKKFAENIKERFLNNNKIHVFPFGLGEKEETLELFISDNSSSVFKQDNGIKEQIEIKEINHFMLQHSLSKIDLIKINIEGAEYALLEAILNSNAITKFENIQIQFHDFVPDAEKRMLNIQQQLSATHHTTFQYPFVWENWKRN